MTAVTSPTRETLNLAIMLREALTDYILADALDGIYRESEWLNMQAAFVLADTDRLAELCAALGRELNFVEPSTVLKTLTRKERQAFQTGDLEKLLRNTPGTRFYARDILDANISEMPFA